MTTPVGIDSRGNLPASNFLGQRSAGARGLASTSPLQKPKGPWGLGGLESEEHLSRRAPLPGSWDGRLHRSWKESSFF